MSKYIKIEQDDKATHPAFLDFLRALPSQPNCANDYQSSPTRFLSKEEAIAYRYIQPVSELKLGVIVHDVDREDSLEFQGEHIGPHIIVKNKDNGKSHYVEIIEGAIFERDSTDKAKNLYGDMKKKLTIDYGADENYSSVFVKNPFSEDFDAYVLADYCGPRKLKDTAKLVKDVKIPTAMRYSKSGRRATYIDPTTVVVGCRNSSTFHSCRIKSYQHVRFCTERQQLVDYVFQTCSEYNDQIPVPMDKAEIWKITRSIVKYTWRYRSKFANGYRRSSPYEGMSQEEIMKIVGKNKTEKTKLKVAHGAAQLLAEGIVPTVTEVSRITGCSRSTVQKPEYKEVIAQVVAGTYCFGIDSHTNHGVSCSSQSEPLQKNNETYREEGKADHHPLRHCVDHHDPEFKDIIDAWNNSTIEEQVDAATDGVDNGAKKKVKKAFKRLAVNQLEKRIRRCNKVAEVEAFIASYGIEPTGPTDTCWVKGDFMKRNSVTFGMKWNNLSALAFPMYDEEGNFANVLFRTTVYGEKHWTQNNNHNLCLGDTVFNPGDSVILMEGETSETLMRAMWGCEESIKVVGVPVFADMNQRLLERIATSIGPEGRVTLVRRMKSDGVKWIIDGFKSYGIRAAEIDWRLMCCMCGLSIVEGEELDEFCNFAKYVNDRYGHDLFIDYVSEAIRSGHGDESMWCYMKPVKAIDDPMAWVYEQLARYREGLDVDFNPNDTMMF